MWGLILLLGTVALLLNWHLWDELWVRLFGGETLWDWWERERR